MSDGKEKLPFVFDKAKYREKKYSHVKKLNDWKKNHKIEAERKYKKMLRKEEKKNQFLAKSNPNMQPLGQKSANINGTENRQLSGLKKAKKTFEDKVAAKKKAEEEAEKRRKEKEEAVKKYKEKKVMLLLQEIWLEPKVGLHVWCVKSTDMKLTFLLVHSQKFLSDNIITHLQAQKSKALRAVTKRGQPVMAGRMELLLAKIQEQCSQ